jgi:hypothetical protein
MIDFEKTEDALIADMKAKGPGLKTVDTFETQYQAKVLRELMPLIPFVLIQWEGIAPAEGERGARDEATVNEQLYHCLVGSSSLRSQKERQRGCYPIIRWLIDRYNGGTVTVDGEPVTFALKRVVPVESDAGIAVYDVVLKLNDDSF